jgi:hypothetical protein
MTPFVYLYYTESGNGSDTTTGNPTPLGNRVYRYTWNGTALVSPTLLLDLPVAPGPNHNGGVIAFGPDGKLYVVIGELNRNGQLQNISTGAAPDDTGVILRINDDGTTPTDNPFSALGSPIDRYYAYGVRNSFGLTFDPITGKLWDTENGPNNFDEINLIEAGQNSGWNRIMGPVARDPQGTTDLVQFMGSHYADPKFSWLTTVGPTAIVFLHSPRLGIDYEDDVFVGDINNGRLYHFRVNATRDGFDFFTPGLADLVADSGPELKSFGNWLQWRQRWNRRSRSWGCLPLGALLRTRGDFRFRSGVDTVVSTGRVPTPHPARHTGPGPRHRRVRRARRPPPAGDDWDGLARPPSASIAPAPAPSTFEQQHLRRPRPRHRLPSARRGSPVVGDWDGNGTTTIGPIAPAPTPSTFGTNTYGAPDLVIASFGAPGSPVVGGWAATATTIGLYRPAPTPSTFGTATPTAPPTSSSPPSARRGSPRGRRLGRKRHDHHRPITPTNTFYLRNSNTYGADLVIASFGAPGDLPVIGDWDSGP